MADNGYQLDLFNSVRPYFKIDKPIRLIELFAGIGAQGCAPTLRTGHDEAKAIKVLEESRERENGIMVKENTKKGYKIAKRGDGVNLANRMKHQRGNVQRGSIQTLKAQMEIGVVVDEDE